MAIDDLLDEHEQSERVRSWLRQNGAGLIGGVVLGLAAIAGWQWWQQQQQVAHEAAGQRFQAALKAIETNDLKQAQPAVAALDKDGAAYATLAGLQLAKAQVDAGQRDAAIATLRAIKSDDAALSEVVQSRLARLLTDAGKPTEALKVLGDKPQAAAALEARADAFTALGKPEDARAAYAQALAKLDVGAPQRRLVELKLTEVGGSPARTEGRTP
jgi:predicted negative regulator of RcsB-dependent stress response